MQQQTQRAKSWQRRAINLLFLAVLSVAACQPIRPPAADSVTPTAPSSSTATATPLPEVVGTPVGTWTTTVTKEDLLRVAPDFLQEYLCDNAGTFIWQFNN